MGGKKHMYFLRKSYDIYYGWDHNRRFFHYLEFFNCGGLKHGFTRREHNRRGKETLIHPEN